MFGGFNEYLMKFYEKMKPEKMSEKLAAKNSFQPLKAPILFYP